MGISSKSKNIIHCAMRAKVGLAKWYGCAKNILVEGCSDKLTPVCYLQKSTNKSANCLMYKVVMIPFQAKHSLLCACSLIKSRQACDVFQIQALQRTAASVSICFIFEVKSWGGSFICVENYRNFNYIPQTIPLCALLLKIQWCRDVCGCTYFR